MRRAPSGPSASAATSGSSKRSTGTWRTGATTPAARDSPSAVVPAGKLIHVVIDNYGTHKHPKVLAWLERHPRWTFHLTPTSSSWLNAVETFFSKLTRGRLRRGSFPSLVASQEAINRHPTSTTG